MEGIAMKNDNKRKKVWVTVFAVMSMMVTLSGCDVSSFMMNDNRGTNVQADYNRESQQLVFDENLADDLLAVDWANEEESGNVSPGKQEQANLEEFDIRGDWMYVYDSLSAITGVLIEVYVTIDSFDGEAIEGMYFYRFLTNQNHYVSENSGRFHLNQGFRTTFSNSVYDYYFVIDNQSNMPVNLVIDREKGLKVIRGSSDLPDFIHPLTRVNGHGLSHAYWKESYTAEQLVGSWRNIIVSHNHRRTEIESYENIIYTFNGDGTFKMSIDSPYEDSGTISGRYFVQRDDQLRNNIVMYQRTSMEFPDMDPERTFEVNISGDRLELRRLDIPAYWIFTRE